MIAKSNSFRGGQSGLKRLNPIHESSRTGNLPWKINTDMGTLRLVTVVNSALTLLSDDIYSGTNHTCMQACKNTGQEEK